MDTPIFSIDEWIVFACAAYLGFTLWRNWYPGLNSVTFLATPSGYRRPLYLVPVVCLIALYFVLQFYASSDVRTSIAYIVFYLLLGLAWLRIGLWLFPFVGLSVRDDMIERHNQAAAFSVFGALIGITLCYAGGNIGEGPSWLVVVLAAGLATATLFLLWMLLNAIVDISGHVTIDRDPAAGLRLAGFLIGAGIILGRAVAGNWVSLEATLNDFVQLAWPVLIHFGVP